MSHAFRNFKEDLQNNCEPDTRKTYTDRFTDFMTFLGVKNAGVFTVWEKTKLEDAVHAYIRRRASEGKGYAFLNQSVSAVRRFCLANRLDLNYSWLYSKIPKPEVSGNSTRKTDQPYTTEQVTAAIQTALKKRRWRAVIAMLLMYVGGVRIGALPEIERSHIKLVEKYGIYAIEGYATSAKYSYWILTTPQFKEQLDGIAGKPGVSKTGRLFVSYRDNAPISKHTLSKEIWQTLVDAGIRTPGLSEHPNMLDHGFRKAHSTALEAAGLRDEDIAHLRGRKEKLAKIYQKPPPLEVVEDTGYMKAVERLTLPLKQTLKAPMPS